MKALRSLVSGTLRRPGDTGFDSASAPFNKRYVDTIPRAVLSVRGPSDVARAIGWARDANLPIVARGGGHSYAGNSVNTGLVLDLGGLNAVRIDKTSGRVTVGGGTRMGVLYRALQAHDLAIPLGNSDDVGIGGLVLGGGVAAVSRAFGLTCDALVETDVVLADGTTVTCNAAEHADLFWACRGGGGGNFGVNTSFTFQARATRPGSTCLLLWSWPAARAVLTRMQEIMAQAPNEFAARIGVNRASGSAGVVSVVGQHLGSATELRELLAPVWRVARPARADIADRTYWEAKDFLRHETSGDPFAVRTRCVRKPLSEAAVDAIVRAVENRPDSANPDGGGVALFTWGGQINRVPVADTAFAHRDALFLVSMDTSWGVDDTRRTVAANLDWLDGLHDQLGAFAPEGAYVNFTDPALTDWRHAYYGPNYPRLARVKRRYDPDRVFDFAQAI